MGKFLAFILSPLKWIKCICHLIYLDIKLSLDMRLIPIIENLDWNFDVFKNTTLKTKKFDDYYNAMKNDYIELLNDDNVFQIIAD